MSTTTLVPIEDYLSLSLPDHEWLVKGIIAKPSYVLLIGDGKSGKSTLALQLALGVAQGTSFLGFPCTKGRVLYVQCDVSDFTWRCMLQSFRERGEPLQGDVFFVHPHHARHYVDVLQKGSMDYLRGIIRECNPSLVVLDLLRELHSGDEQDSTVMRVVINNLLEVVGGAGLLLVHHSHKLDPTMGADPIRSSRGSSYIPGRADNVLLLHQSSLIGRGRFGPPLHIPLRRKGSGFWGRV